MGTLPATQRGSDVRCLCVNLEAQEQGYKGFKFSRVGGLESRLGPRWDLYEYVYDVYIYSILSKDRVQVAYRIISVPLHRLQALSCTRIQRAVERGATTSTQLYMVAEQ